MICSCRKVNGSALYIVVITALVIAIFCASMIAAAYFCRLQSQVKSRSDRLQQNVHSGINILLTATDTAYLKRRYFSLFQNSEDSVLLQRIPWGIFTVGISKAMIQKDTLYKVFLIANRIDSAKWSSVYLADEDRPLSVSGRTTITGNAFLPKAGVRAAYVDNNAYLGDKRFVTGHIYHSDKKLPDLNLKVLEGLKQLFIEDTNENLPRPGSAISRSFRSPTVIFNLKKNTDTLRNLTLNGNIRLHSDTTLVIDSSVHLKDILIDAPAVVFAPGFRGNCQVFALDSVSTGSKCHFAYPSIIGIVRFNAAPQHRQAVIRLGKNTILNGAIFAYEKEENKLKPFIALSRSVVIGGQVYSPGSLSLQDSVKVNGNLTSRRFLYQTSFNAYENYLINVNLRSTELSRYYLISPLMPASSKSQKVLQWLENN